MQPTILFLLTLLSIITPNQVPTTPSEPPAPEPTAAVRVLLTEADAQAKAKQFAAMKVAAEKALVAAQNARDIPGEALAWEQRASALEGQGQDSALAKAEAADAWKEAYSAWKRCGDGPGQVRSLCHSALFLAHPQATLAVNEAVSISKAEERRPLATAKALTNAGIDFYPSRQMELAVLCWKASHAILESKIPESHGVAASAANLGAVCVYVGDVKGAKAYYVEAQRIFQKKEPESLDLAAVFLGLGTVARYQDDLESAEGYFQRAVNIQHLKAPGSLDEAYGDNGLGTVAFRRGDLTIAEQAFNQTLQIIRANNAARDLPDVLCNLAGVAEARGDLASAEQSYRQALAIQEVNMPGALDVATTYNGLAVVALDRGDFISAEAYLKQALEIFDVKAPNSPEKAIILSNLGMVAQSKGDLDQAENNYRKAMKTHAQGSLAFLQSLNDLGNVAYERYLNIPDNAPHKQDMLKLAACYYNTEIKAVRKIKADPLYLAYCLANLGAVHWWRKDLTQAQHYYEQARAIFTEKAPDSLTVASALDGLSNIAYKRGDFKASCKYASDAWNIVRQQTHSLLSDDTGLAFADKSAAYAAQLLRCQAALGDTKAAFTTLQQSHAQALVNLLLKRDLLQDATADALRVRNRERDKALQAVSNAQQERNRYESDLQKVRSLQSSERQRLEVACAKAEQSLNEARFAYTLARDAAAKAMQQIQKEVKLPKPLIPAEAQKAMPPNTLYIAYSVSADESDLLLLARDRSLQILPLVLKGHVALSLADLTQQVHNLQHELSSDSGQPLKP